MKLAILETGRPPGDLGERFGDYPAMFARLLGPGFELEPFDVQAGTLPADAASHEAYLVTGSPAGVYDPLPWIAPLCEFIRVSGNRKMVGICFGHQVMAEAFGTMQGGVFVGMPPVQSVLIPFSLPELTLYKNQSQSGYARLHMDIYDNRTGEFLGSTPKLIGRAYFNQYTLLLLATWHRTDVTAPPVAGQ